ncbi:MAG TPA: LamG-like jellyroll fold domain-containing protein, partial [Candidatus Paceibacterota bacterium]|nr:LamG-like jellyroll fold domain-containing protein [Candidatus Paceibacterota bacterium]
MGFYNALTSGACSIDGSGRCSSQDAPNAGCVLPVFAKKGTGTLQIGYKYSGMTRVRADSNCLKLPLKSGGLLSLAWHQFTGLASSDPTGSSRLFAARPEGWQTGGQSGMFSFLPYISNVSSLGAFNKFTDVFPVSSDGLTHYKRKGISGAIHYFETVNPMPMRARYDHSTYYFYDFDFDSSTYFKYGGTNNALDGRVIYTRDLFGNQLDYTYSARQVNPSGYSPLLRKITGNISGVTPYFEYGDASNEQFIPAPIKKIFIKDEADSSKSRTVYYDYNSYTSAPNCFLNAITYPTGCRTHYRFSVDGGGHPFMIKEADAEGYATYFNWTGTSSIRKVMEPEGILTYYRYDTANLNTLETPLPKSTAYYKYTLSSDASGNIEQLSKSVDRMRNTTYYQWTYFAANNFYGNHLKRKHAPNGFVQYFEYNDKNSMTLLARHSRRIQYSYAQNERDVSKVTNARGYTSYFAYTNRILTSTVHPDGSSTTSSLDSIGRVRSACDARGNTTYFNYDPNTGSMASQVMPGGSVAYFRYNSFRNLVRDVSPRWSESSFAGFTTYYEFNSLGRPIKKIDPLSGLTYFSYTSRNDLSTITSPNAMTRVYVYDGKRRLTNYIVEANNGDVIETVSCYDSTGNGVYDVSPSLLVEQNRFDNNDRNTAFSRGLTNVQGFWPLHESSGNRADESGRNNLLIDNNTVGSASGLFGLNAAQFIRSNSEYLSITNAAQTGLGITGALSLAGFFQISNIATGTWLRPIASKWGASATSDRGYSFGIRRDSTTGLLYPYFLLSSNGGSSYELVFGASFNFSVNTWYHLAATYEPQTKLVCIYVDGVRVAMRYCTQGSIKSNTAEFRLGVHASTESITWAGIAHTIQYFDGLLEDVYVFDVAIARALVELLSRQDRERKIKDASVTTYGYYSFDSVGNRRKVTDARQNTTYFNFNMYSEVASVKKADGSETYYFYDLNGNLTVSRDPRLHSTYFSYDPRDQQNCVRDALGRSTYFFFDANGNTTRWRNARLNTTYFFYDPMDRVKARRDAQGNSAYFFFDANGNVIRSRNERLNTTYHFYDALDRRRSTRDALANLTYYYFDSVGNTTRVKDPKGNTTYFFYD